MTLDSLPDLEHKRVVSCKDSFHGADVLAVSEHGAPGRRPNIHAHFVGPQREDGLDTLIGGQMARGQGSPVSDKAEWLLRFAVMSLATPRDFRRLRPEAHRWLDPAGARPLEWAELRDVQAHIQGGLTA